MAMLRHSVIMNSIIKDLCNAAEEDNYIDIIDVRTIIKKHKTVVDTNFSNSRNVITMAIKEGYFVSRTKKIVRQGRRLTAAYVRTNKEYEEVLIERSAPSGKALMDMNDVAKELNSLFGINIPSTIDLSKVNRRVVNQMGEFDFRNLKI